MKIILLGAPGAGKGTYASRLKNTYDVPHISMGDLFREAIKNNTETGLKAKEFMDRGEFVPDEITINLLKERLNDDDTKNGILLDGFPRTLEQAKLLDEIMDIKGVLKFDLGEDVVLRRLGGRLICKGCGEIFNKHRLPPQEEGICDKCKDELYQRDDDKEETILKRLEMFNLQTKPLAEYYSDKNILHEIDANIDIIDPACTVIQDCEKVLDEIKSKL